MAIVDTAESAVADAGRRECYLLCKEVKALLPRSQGFRLEFGGFKLSVFPECKAKWPPGAKSGRGWRDEVLLLLRRRPQSTSLAL